MTAKKHRKSAYVPRLLVRTAIVGVVPACAIVSGSSACGRDPGPGVAGFAYDASQASVADAFFGGVADVGYRESGFGGVADAGYRESGFGGVADAGYRESGAPDANPDGGSDARPDSRFFGVAAVAYPAYEAGNG